MTMLDTLAPGLRLTVFGMGLVFLLLGLLSLLVRVLLGTDRPGSPAVSAPAPPAGARAALASPLSDPELLAAVVIAVRAHRIHLRRQAAPPLRAHQPGTLPSRWVGAGRTRQNRSFTPGGRYT